MPRSQQTGFTLLELLIAIVIVSLIMTTAFGAIRIGSRSWEAGQQRTDAIEEMRSYAEFLRRQVGQTVIASWEDGDGKRIAFSGQQQALRFVAPAPSAADSIGLLTYALMIDNDANGSRLRIEYAPYDPGALAFDESRGRNMIEPAATFASVRFDYFGATEKDSAESWRPEWPAAAALYPEIVRITFDSNDGDPVWPDLVLPLRSRQVP